jgi:membrane-associated PAP2 superfamily phosphatase
MSASIGSAQGLDAQFFWFHAWLPLLGMAATVFVLACLNVDQLLADHLFAWQGHRWALRDSVIADQLIHRTGRNFSLLLWVGVGIAWIASRFNGAWRHLHTPLAYLLLSTLAATVLVACMKSWTNMDCPWDLQRYGGDRPFVALFAPRAAQLPQGQCFPAGHASAGYAWLALYFFFTWVSPRHRSLGLAIGIAMGLLFGLGQQVRGAHFLSHDLCTAAICWSTSLAMYCVLVRRRSPLPGTTSRRPWRVDQ